MIRLPSSVAELARPQRPIALGERRDWYRIENKDSDETAIYIYDEIGYWGTTAQAFVKDLQKVNTKRISLHLNTPGGDVFDGIAIHNALRQHAASVTVQVDSLAASIGSVIAMAGDRIVMAKHATMMIHDPFTFAFGNAADMRKTAEILDQLGDTIASVYAERAGGSVREWRDRMLEETWYSDREAVGAGLADEVDGDAEPVQGAWDLSIFKHPPEHLQTAARASSGERQPTKRDIERALRDAGLSRGTAKAVVAAWGRSEHEDEARDVSSLVALRDALTVLL